MHYVSVRERAKHTFFLFFFFSGGIDDPCLLVARRALSFYGDSSQSRTLAYSKSSSEEGRGEKEGWAILLVAAAYVCELKATVHLTKTVFLRCYLSCSGKWALRINEIGRVNKCLGFTLKGSTASLFPPWHTIIYIYIYIQFLFYLSAGIAPFLCVHLDVLFFFFACLFVLLLLCFFFFCATRLQQLLEHACLLMHKRKV